MEVKKPYVQMPKSDNDEAVKLLAKLVEDIEETLPTIESPLWQTYVEVKEYLKIKLVISEKELR